MKSYQVKFFILAILISLKGTLADDACLCGPFSYHSPSSSIIPPGPYMQGIDYKGNDMQPCGSTGCKMPANSTHLDCESKCNSTKGCIAYIWDEAGCDGNKESICWLKSGLSNKRQRKCRNSRIVKPS